MSRFSTGLPRLNPVLLSLAEPYFKPPGLEKAAIVPAGAMGGPPPPGADPSQGGGAPPPPPGGAPPPGAPPPGADPSQGGAPPSQLDPALQQAIQQAVQQGAMGGGAAGGKGGKKLEQQVMDTKLWTMQYILVMIADSLGIKLPPQLVVGPPPDPGAMQMAQADSATMGGGSAAPMAPDPSQAGGAPPAGGGGPIAPPEPVEAAQMGGAPKAAFAVGQPFNVEEFLPELEQRLQAKAAGYAGDDAVSSLAARARALGRRAELLKVGG